MKRTCFSFLLALVVGFGFSCENKRETTETTTTVTGEVADDETITTAPADGTAVDIESDTGRITTGTPPIKLYTTDQDFVAMAASSGMLEVELGKLASQKATNADVKKFGQQMVTDHTAANKDLKVLAGLKKWSVPAKMNADHQAVYDRFTKLSNKEFDRDYTAQMLIDHEAAVGMFEQATRQATDTDLKAFASKTLPTLRQHLDMARNLNGN